MEYKNAESIFGENRSKKSGIALEGFSSSAKVGVFPAFYGSDKSEDNDLTVRKDLIAIVLQPTGSEVKAGIGFSRNFL